MRGVTMHAGTPITVVVILGLCTILEATYLERPLWVADKGIPLSTGSSVPQDQSRAGQIRASNEQSWLIPEPYYPSRSVADAAETRVESPQWSWDQLAVEQNVREERPMVENVQPNRPYEYQTMYYGQGAMGGAVQPSNEPVKQVELPKPAEPVVDGWKPSQVKPEFEYPSFNGQQGWDMPAKPEMTQPNPYQPQSGQALPTGQQEPTLPKEQETQQTYEKPQTGYEMYQSQQAYNAYPPRPEMYRPEPEYQMPYYGQQPSQYMLIPEYQMQVPIVEPEYQKKPEPQPEPTLPKEQETQQTYGKPQTGYEMYQSQQAFNAYPPRPEMYRPEPEYQIPYYGQQPSQYMPETNYQMTSNRKPSVESVKPQPDINRVRQPKPEPAPNMGYYPYQQQEWNPYQATERQQASLQATEQEIRGRENLAVNPNYQQAYENSPPLRAPAANRQPAQPPKVGQRPNRPIEREPEREPIRVPSTQWEMQYKPVQPAPQPKPKPQVQRPPQVMPQEPTYNRRPVEMYYEDDDDDEVVVKYEKPVTRYDARCPRDDDPAKPVHFPSVASCVKFQKCFNGIAYEMSCPPGLEFDAKNNRCDYPARARCSVVN